MKKFWYTQCDPENLEAGAVVYEGEVPIARTVHIPGWVASDHDDAADYLATELHAAKQAARAGGIKHCPVDATAIANA